MSTNKNLEDYQNILKECVKCGACQAHCPTYLVTRQEGAVARGKNALAAALLAGSVQIDDGLKDDIELCLMCGSCLRTCPNLLPTHEIVGAVRRKIAENGGGSAFSKTVGAITGSKRILGALSKAGSVLSPLLSQKIPDTSGLRLRLSPSAMKDRTVPQIPFHNLFDLVPEWTEGQPAKATVGFFAGCGIAYVYPQIGRAMVDILQRLGYSVFFPHLQQCCGIPALSAGLGQLNERLAAANIAAFSTRKCEYIITACASCNSGIGEHYQQMNAPAEFTGKVLDFSQFLDRQGVLEHLRQLPRSDNPVKVTYHDPCHLKNQGIITEPRLFLQALPHIEYVEMEKANACCGFGGTFSAKNYPLSRVIGSLKIAGLTNSGAELVATSCPGCIIQLQDIINHAGLKMKAVHLLDLIPPVLDHLPAFTLNIKD